MLTRLRHPPPLLPLPPKQHPDTYWRSVVAGAVTHETLPLEHPPTHYYHSHCEDPPKRDRPRRIDTGRSQERARLARAQAMVAA
jgi:hypothetical protein